MTKKDIIERLKELNIDFDTSATKKELETILKETSNKKEENKIDKRPNKLIYKDIFVVKFGEYRSTIDNKVFKSRDECAIHNMKLRKEI